jgi:fibronectin-binding autotransporter adhesin
MATWKKVIVSGSNVSQLNNDAGYLTSATTGKAFSTASYDGTSLLADSSGGNLSFASGSGQGLTISASVSNDTLTFGLSQIPNSSLTNTGSIIGNTSIALGATVTTIDGLNLTNTTATGSFSGSFIGVTDLPDLTSGIGIDTFTYDGSGTATVALANGGALQNDTIQKWDGGSGFFVNSGLVEADGKLSSTDSIQFTGANSSLTGSFTGSFAGDGSGLTGIASNLAISGSTGDGSVALKTQVLSILGTNNEIETNASGQSITIGLPNNVTIGNDLVVSNNLTVFGTASFQNTTNLEVADRFILLASGSNTAGDGGLVVQQDTQDVGELFGWDSGVSRWGVTGSFTASNSSYTPDAFMAAAIIGAGIDPTVSPSRYQAAGNIFIGTDEGIWIYS